MVRIKTNFLRRLRDVNPLARFCGMLVSVHALIGGLEHMSHLRLQDRTFLMSGVYFLVSFPWALIWTAHVASFMQYAGLRWMLAGALTGLSGAGFLVKAGVPERLDLFPPEQLMHLRFVVFLAHVGFGLAYAMYSTLFANLGPPTSCQTDDVITASVNTHGRHDQPSDKDTTIPKSEDSADPNAVATCVFTMVWLAACYCQTIAEDVVISGISDGSTKLALVIGPAIYLPVAWIYTRISEHVKRECGNGLLLGGASLIVLRCTSSNMAWQSWMMDCALAFVCANAGLMGSLFM